MLKRLKPVIDETAKELIDEMAARPDCDFITDVANIHPLKIICRILGMPEADEPLILVFETHGTARIGVLESGRGRPWEVRISPYGFLANVEGDVWADADKTSVKIPFEEIIKRTTAGGMLNVTFGYRRWFVELDGLYGRIEDEFDVGTLNTSVRVNQYQLELILGRRLYLPSLSWKSHAVPYTHSYLLDQLPFQM